MGRKGPKKGGGGEGDKSSSSQQQQGGQQRSQQQQQQGGQQRPQQQQGGQQRPQQQQQGGQQRPQQQQQGGEQRPQQQQQGGQQRPQQQGGQQRPQQQQHGGQQRPQQQQGGQQRPQQQQQQQGGQQRPQQQQQGGQQRSQQQQHGGQQRPQQQQQQRDQQRPQQQQYGGQQRPRGDQQIHGDGQQTWRQAGPPQQQQHGGQQTPRGGQPTHGDGQQAWRQTGPPQQQQQVGEQQSKGQGWRKGGPQQQGGRGRQQPQQESDSSRGFGRGRSQDFPQLGVGQQSQLPSSPSLSSIPSTSSQSLSSPSEGSSPRKGPQKQQQKHSHEGSPVQQMQKMQIGPGGDNLPSMERDIKPGVSGRVVKLEANHLALNLGNIKEAYHYDVNLDPDRPKNMLRQVMEIFRQQHYPKTYPAFDGRKNLYSCKLLCPKDQVISGTVTVRDDDREKQFKVEVKFANTVDMSPLRELLKDRSPQEAIQCVDIVLRNAPASRCITFGRSFFIKPRDRLIDLGEGMEMYYGFYQSAIRCWKPLLNVDVAHKAFPKDIPVTKAICEVLDDYRYPFQMDNLRQGLDPNQQETFNKYIATLKVVYQIPGVAGSRKVYRVNKLGPPGDTYKFKSDDGEYTVASFFQVKRGVRLQYPKITLWVGSRERNIYLPAELCTIMEGQPLTRKMTENQTSKMIKEAATNTSTRKAKIMNGVQQSNYNADPCVSEFGFSVANKFEEIEGRILDPPLLKYRERSVKPSKGVWRNDLFFRGIDLERWTILETDRPNNNTRRLADLIMRAGRNVGMEIRPCTQPIDNVRPERVSEWFAKKKGNFQLVIVVVPSFGDAYNKVKSAAELEHGCLTQCIKSRTVSRINDQIVTNILLKVNSKLNGVNHTFMEKPLLLKRPIMIMGADVTHPSPDSRNIPSVAAVTASHGPNAFKYNICWRLQPPRTEIIDDLTDITKEHLMMFYKHNNVKPERIIFFRDGVSEGQFDQVRRAEINAIRRACTQIQADGEYKPAITFLVVQKRHHTRLFPVDPRISEDKNCNVPAGTCVDKNIVHPYMQDFYLVSHASIQGVAKPTKYCTIYDDSNLSNDDIENFTYYLCHMFSRCNRAVSYPAPTYYAHLAAARAKVYVEKKNLNMNDLRRETVRYAIKDEIRKDHPMFFV